MTSGAAVWLNVQKKSDRKRTKKRCCVGRREEPPQARGVEQGAWSIIYVLGASGAVPGAARKGGWVTRARGVHFS